MRSTHIVGLMVLSLALIVRGSAAHAQDMSVATRAFAPGVVPPVTIVPPPPNRAVCQRPVPSAPSGTTIVVDAPEADTAFDWRTMDNPYFREALNRWAIGEYVREHVFERRPSEEEVLNLVRHEYTLPQILQRLCRSLPEGTVCQPRIVWRATFVRTPWCATVDAGGQPLPAADTVVVGTMHARVCLAGPSSPLPCPAPNRVGRVRAMRGDVAELVAQPSAPADEQVVDIGTAGDVFGYGGIGTPTLGWGGGGTGEGNIGMGDIGMMGHGSGVGSGQGYGTGAGRGLRNRGTAGPTVRAVPPMPPSP